MFIISVTYYQRHTAAYYKYITKAYLLHKRLPIFSCHQKNNFKETQDTYVVAKQTIYKKYA